MTDEEMIVLSIPKEWEDTYIKLLTVISQSGEAILNDCSYGCKGDGSIMFNCWNIFQAACAAHALGNTKRANLYIDYVNKQIANKFGEVIFKTKADERIAGIENEVAGMKGDIAKILAAVTKN